ncbi:MAG: dihydrofolate reductase family protein [Candidatus Phosphoribacter sp.]|nr:dihydrofolate reductase family protein [Actinomycetales bacterium]
MRLLLAPTKMAGLASPGSTLDLASLAAAYALPDGAGSWLGVTMVSTLDGAATGADGRSGSINTPADTVVFDLIRALSDIVLVGAGTARAEGYTPLVLTAPYAALRAAAGLPPTLPMAVVTRSGNLPTALRTGAPGAVWAITVEASPGLARLRADLGADRVIVAGVTQLDLPAALAGLHAQGFRRINAEGGPTLLGALLAEGLVDELDLTLSPALVGGRHGRIVAHGELSVSAAPHVLLEADGTLIGRWLIRA